jgi:transposase-like protein
VVPDRNAVLRYADQHGAAAAAKHFGISANTIRSWRSRARKRAGRRAEALHTAGADSPADRFKQEARRIVEWAASGGRICLQCAGQGTVTVPAAKRGELLLQPSIPSPARAAAATARASS